MSTSGSPSTTTTPRTAARHTDERRVAHFPAVIAVVLLLLTVAACGSDATITETAAPGAQTQPAAPTTAATAPTAEAAEPTSAPEPAETTPKDSPSATLRQANAAWRAQDWAGLSAVATPDVVAVAQAAGSPDDEGPLELVEDNLDVAWRCSLDGAPCSDGLWACDAGGASCNGEILYGYEPDADCCAAIYLVTISIVDDTFHVTSLSFAGDAG